MKDDTVFFLTCNEGRNQGITGDEQLRDVFTLSDADKTPLFLITYTCEQDNGIDSMQVKRLGNTDASALPFVLDGIDLGYKVYERLVMMLDEQEAEFFADMFVNDSGNPIDLPITFPAPAPKPTTTACDMGIHSWSDVVGLLPPDTTCEHCGEPYGHPD